MSSEEPQLYGDKVLSFINQYSSSIRDRASIISQLTSLAGANLISSTNLERYIAGVIAEEFNDRYESGLDIAIQAAGDWYLRQYSENELSAAIAAIDVDPTLWDLRGLQKFEWGPLIDVGPASSPGEAQRNPGRS